MDKNEFLSVFYVRTQNQAQKQPINFASTRSQTMLQRCIYATVFIIFATCIFAIDSQIQKQKGHCYALFVLHAFSSIPGITSVRLN